MVTLTEEPHNPSFVKTVECLTKHEKLDLALFGKDGRAGIVKDITDIKNFMKNTKESSRNWRSLIYPTLTGLVLFAIGYVARYVGGS